MRRRLSQSTKIQLIYSSILPKIFALLVLNFAMENYNKQLKQYAQDLRNGMTDAEKKLWKRLKRKQLLGIQFYRQKPLLHYIVDFYCPAAKLIIECDGHQHHTADGLFVDHIRDQALSELGLSILRFDNRQVLLETDQVCQVIADHIKHVLTQSEFK